MRLGAENSYQLCGDGKTPEEQTIGVMASERAATALQVRKLRRFTATARRVTARDQAQARWSFSLWLSAGFMACKMLSFAEKRFALQLRNRDEPRIECDVSATNI